ncbi:ATP-binding protein [Actinomadura sediminis]|uniref:ATP-binding protein n=1 Tax=Actinomadura sediminis TaxID=1038904 RepID=A0ABW3ER06_9ACTN
MGLLAVESSVVLVRELVRYALANWAFGRAAIDDTVVVASEIVTNAVKAAYGREIRVRVAVRDGSALFECWDPSPELPRARRAGPDDLDGRGLAIVAAYAKESGVRPSGTGVGKVVWAVIG